MRVGHSQSALAKITDQDPEQLKSQLEKLKKKGQLSPEEQQLKDLLELLIEAAKSGNLGALKNALGNGGALRNLMNDLGGGGFGDAFRNGGSAGTNFANMKPWSQEDRDFLDKALVSEPEQFRDQIGSWRQGQEGNCAAVATIKAATDRYDNKVFDSVQRGADGSYQIKMQDGFQVNLSERELSMAKLASNFHGSDSSAKSYGQLCYAAMAKRAEMEHHKGAQNYGQALRALNTGDDPRNSARWLGLQNQMISVNPRTLNGQDSVVAWSQRHAVFVNKERDGTHRTDHYGQGQWFNGTDTNGFGLMGAFTFRDRANSSRELASFGSLGANFNVASLGPGAWSLPRREIRA